jgi:glucoamylase
MAHMTGPGGLIPEQVWDSDPIPERMLYPGKPTGSAMPLVWAHAEFLKLLLARETGKPIEQFDAVTERHGHRPPHAASWFWRTEAPVDRLPPGRALVIENAEPFVLHFGFDGWQNVAERASTPLAFTMHGVRLEPNELADHAALDFTRRSPPAGSWEGADHTVELLSER